MHNTCTSMQQTWLHGCCMVAAPDVVSMHAAAEETSLSKACMGMMSHHKRGQHADDAPEMWPYECRCNAESQSQVKHVATLK